MEFLKTAKRRSVISELVYIGLNVGLAVMILITVWTFANPLPAFLLTFISKWRVLAVRPRFWLANIQANLVDLIVSVSFVITLYDIGQTSGAVATGLQVLLTVFYILWLVVLKPRSSQRDVTIQAGVAVFAGVSALFSVSYGWPSSVVVLAMWLIGYGTARHILSHHSDQRPGFLSFIWGFVIAEIGWLMSHWTIAYDTVIVESLKIPQASIIVVAISFIAERVYASYAKHGEVKSSDVAMPIALSVGVIMTLLVAFMGNGTNQI